MRTRADELRDIRAVIEEHGWMQAPRRADAGPTCLLFAASRVHALNAMATWRRANDMREESIVAWNDAPGRTLEDVMASIDRAIEFAQAREFVCA